jgi:hypothetical protein
MLTKESQQAILKIIPTLNEAQTRWIIAKEATSLGRGGLKYMHELTGVSRPTILRGVAEISCRKKLDISEGLRATGGGRKALEQQHPDLQQAIKKIMDETTAGDPMNALLWTCKSTYKIAEELAKQGYKISQRSVCRKLSEMDYSLQLNAKHKEGTGKDHPDRDQQFRYINAIVKKFFSKENPVISVDAKKKELVGEFKNNGRTWRHKAYLLSS